VRVTRTGLHSRSFWLFGHNSQPSCFSRSERGVSSLLSPASHSSETDWDRSIVTQNAEQLLHDLEAAHGDEPGGSKPHSPSHSKKVEKHETHEEEVHRHRSALDLLPDTLLRVILIASQSLSGKLDPTKQSSTATTGAKKLSSTLVRCSRSWG